MSQSRAATLLAVIVMALAGVSTPLASQTPPQAAAQDYSQALDSYLGAQVQSVDFRSSVPISAKSNLERDKQELLRILPIKPGDTLTRRKLHNSIQALQSTGRFAGIEVEATPVAPNQVALVFVTKPNYFVGLIRVERAPQPPTANQLANASKLELGQLFTPAALDRAIAQMKRVLEDNGYYKSAIEAHYILDPDSQQATIGFRVLAGDRALVGKVTVSGDPGISVDEVMDLAKIHPGDAVAVSRVTRALTRLRKRYQNQKRLEAQVAVSDRKYHPESNTLDYNFNIQPGPTVDIVIEGAKLREGLIKRYVPVYEENAVDDDLLNEGRRNLRDYFQTKGFFEAKVDYNKSVDGPSAQHLSISFDVDRGERHKLVELSVEGNKYFDTETIRERMQIQPASLLLFYGRFSQSMLAQDLETVRNLYTENGFLHANITSSVKDDYEGKGNIRVIVRVDEGPQSKVQSLKIEGNKTFPEERLRDLVSISEGQPYSEFNISNDRDAIVSFYFDHGFPDVKFDSFAEPDANVANRMNVRYQIAEGKQEFVDRLLVAGLENTHAYVVRREINLKPTEPLSQREMLETQRRLYDIGIFNEVNVAVQNPQGSLDNKNIIVQVDEAKRYTFTYGLGLEVQSGNISNTCVNQTPTGGQVSVPCSVQGETGVSPRATLDLTRINFLGRDHTILFKSLVGRLQQRGLVSYEAPRWMNSDNKTLTFTAFYDKTQDVNTFTGQRLEGSAQIRHVVSKGTTLLYGLTYRRVSVDQSTLHVATDQIPLLAKPVRVSFPGLAVVRDTRDNPITSSRGTYTSADVSVAGKIFGSQSSFSKLLIQNSTYYQLTKNAKVERRWVFARSLKIGIEEPFGSVNQAFVPLPERFYAGGGSSIRGFSINQAGPRDLQTGFPLGGNAMFVNSFELRTPPIALPYLDENVSAVFFHDAGNVFATTKDMFTNIFRISQRSVASCRDAINPSAGCDFNYVSHAVGAGLRYKTPIGPVRVDVGYNLNPTVFPIRTTTPPQSETLRRFNFYFSIGQTF
ncbi:MAG: surface antigen [Acidobacteriaceae bacterium]|nr:surface antigen [Acidobacteriaceae bacterium]